jgi:molybdenum cofactor guanylyltransferase
MTNRSAAVGPGFGAAVLAGGASRRMGHDKATTDVGGRLMAQRVAAAAGSAGAVVVVQIGGPPSGLTRLEDRWPGEGPLGGIVTALCHARRNALAWWLIVACDLPLLDAPTIDALYRSTPDRAGRPAPDVVVAVTDRREPLCAMWRVDSVAAPLEAAFAAGERSVTAALATLAIAGLVVADVAVAADALHNVNTPNDLDHARRIVDP